MKKCIAVGLSLFMLVAIACSSIAQLNPTTIPTFTITPRPVPTTNASFLSPTSAPPLTGTPEALLEWEGIPIMPGATTGEGDEEGYVFIIRATPQEVQEYYQLELEKLGWQAFATDEDGSSLMLVFMNEASATLTISVIAKGDEVLVLLGKSE